MKSFKSYSHHPSQEALHKVTYQVRTVQLYVGISQYWRTEVWLGSATPQAEAVARSPLLLGQQYWQLPLLCPLSQQPWWVSHWPLFSYTTAGELPGRRNLGEVSHTSHPTIGERPLGSGSFPSSKLQLSTTDIQTTGEMLA